MTDEDYMDMMEQELDRRESRRRGCIFILFYLAAIFAVMVLFWIQVTGGF